MDAANNRLNRNQSKFYWAFVASTLIAFSPFKALAYLAPAIFLAFFIFNRPLFLNKTIITRGFILGLLVIGMYFFYKKTYRYEFNTLSFFLGVFTYSAFYPFFLLDYTKFRSKLLLSRVIKFSGYFFAFQGLIGIIQAVYGFLTFGTFDSANGDHVEGTVHLPLPSELSFANPIFSCNMICLLVVILVGKLSKIRNTPLYLVMPGVLSILLGSVIHQIMIFIVAILMTIVYLPKPKMISNLSKKLNKKIYIGLALAAIPMVIFLGRNLSGLIAIPKDIILKDGIPKAIVTKHILLDVPQDYPKAPIYGLGLGQFSSRAGLIASGIYLGSPESPKELPIFGIKTNPIAEKYVFDVIVEFSKVSYFGSTQKPYYSILSLYSEFGLIGILIVAILVLRLVYKTRRIIKNGTDSHSLFYGFGIVSITLFVAGLGIQVNYYEVVQAIFLGMLIILLLKAQLFVKSDR